MDDKGCLPFAIVMAILLAVAMLVAACNAEPAPPSPTGRLTCASTATTTPDGALVCLPMPTRTGTEVH